MKMTSIEIYNQIKEKGILSQLRLTVFEFVCRNPGCTSLDAEKFHRTKNYSSVAARFGELEDMGLIKSTGTIFQEERNRTIYEITGRIEPVSKLKLLRDKLIRKENKLSRLYAEIEIVRKEIARVEKTNQLVLGV